EGHHPYLSLQDLHLWAVGYVDCFLEIQEQLAAMGVQANYIYLTSSHMSQAGLMLGARATGAPLGVVGVSPSHHQADSRERMASLSTEAGRFLGLDVSFCVDDVNNTDAYVGEGYGRATPAGIGEIKLVAQSEAVLLDPGYS